MPVLRRLTRAVSPVMCTSAAQASTGRAWGRGHLNCPGPGSRGSSGTQAPLNLRCLQPPLARSTAPQPLARITVRINVCAGHRKHRKK